MLKKQFAVLMALGSLTIGGVAFASSSSGSPVDANIFVNLSKKIVPSVVNISTTMTVKQREGGQGSPDDLFRKFFEDYFHNHNGMGPRGGGGDDQDDEDQGPPPGDDGEKAPKNGKKQPNAMSLGTGFIIDASGLILTNNHVVADADEIKIAFTEDLDEKPIDGTVVGRDTELDIALIKVKTDRTLTPVVLGDSDSLEVGEYVIAVGNPFGQGHSVTHGIISAKGRLAPDFPLTSYLQTDAPINPGNSGGPLVNLKGEVIGINNAIDQRAQGIGFAIPINVVKKILPQLKTKGMVSRGYIGVLVNELSPDVAQQLGVPKDQKNPFVTHVFPGDPADKAGLKPYDIILEFNNKTIHSSAELIAAVTSVNVGDTVPIKVSRNGKSVDLKIKVTQRPGTEKAAAEEKKKGSKKNSSRIDTGMTLDELTPDIAREIGATDKLHGAVVSNVGYGTPADKSGLMRGDVIIEVNRKPIKDVDSFYSIVKEKKSYLLRVRRMDPSGKEAYAVVVLDLKD